MGLCSSAADSDPEGAVPPAQGKCKDQVEFKLLLLGAGQSGKSTLFKQLTSIYGAGFSSQYRATYTHIVIGNVIESIQALVSHVGTLKDSKDAEIREVEISSELSETVERVMRTTEALSLGSKLASDISSIWKDAAIQLAYRQREKFQLLDSAAYFLDKVQEIGKPGYVPSETDIIRSQARTAGVVEGKFMIKGNMFHILDVGGHRSERKRWVTHFEQAHGLIFVVALSAYCIKLCEDNKTNRMLEAIELFDLVVNSPLFRKKPIVLFLNKTDVFKEKIKNIPLTVCKPFAKHFKGDPYSFEETSDYLQEYFERLSGAGKRIYTHFTCATDHNLVRPVFESMKDSLLEDFLAAGGI